MLEKERRAELKKRIAEQNQRILKQKRMEIKRAIKSKLRGEKITGSDELEKVKLAKQITWRNKWNNRMAKWEARRR